MFTLRSHLDFYTLVKCTLSSLYAKLLTNTTYNEPCLKLRETHIFMQVFPRSEYLYDNYNYAKNRACLFKS